jgi:hypothetical protein
MDLEPVDIGLQQQEFVYVLGMQADACICADRVMRTCRMLGRIRRHAIAFNELSNM